MQHKAHEITENWCHPVQVAPLLVIFILNILLLQSPSVLENQNLPDRWTVHWPVLKEVFFLLFCGGDTECGGVWKVPSQQLLCMGQALLNLTWSELLTSLERLNLNLEIQVDLSAVLTLSFSFSLFTEGHSFIRKSNIIQDKANLN